mgnify:FL=1
MWNFGTRYCNVGSNLDNGSKHAVKFKDVAFEVDGFMLQIDEFYGIVFHKRLNPVDHREAIGS